MIHSTGQKRNMYGTSCMAPGRYMVSGGYGQSSDVEEYSSSLMSFLLHSSGRLQFLWPRVPPLLTKCLCAGNCPESHESLHPSGLWGIQQEFENALRTSLSFLRSKMEVYHLVGCLLLPLHPLDRD